MSQINTIFEINGHSFEFDVHDFENAKRFEDAFDKLTKTENVLVDVGKKSDAILGVYNMFVTLYDDIFGQGVGVKIVGEKPNSRICMETYEKFLDFIAKQRQDGASFRDVVLTKYSPNRAQRRKQGNK